MRFSIPLIALIVAVVAFGWQDPVNLDRHPGMKPSGVNAATAHIEMARAQAPAASGIQPVTTRSGSNMRYGTYLTETRLTPEVVRGGLSLLATLKLPGDRRIEAQTLFANSVAMKNGSHDLAIQATNANQVYAFDAKTYKQLWMRTLGKPIKSIQKIDSWLTNDSFGILGTPVIVGGSVYCVAWVSADGNYTTAHHFLYEVRLRDGSVARKLQLPGDPGMPRKQRSALTALNLNGTDWLFIPWGTIFETANGAHGFITAVNLKTFTVATEWSATQNGNGSGIWMAGSGPTAWTEKGTNGQDAIYLVLMTGNGDFDPDRQNYSESFVKIRFNGASFEVVDWWTPFTDAGRIAGLSEEEKQKWNDSDLGSGAPIVVPELGIIGGAGKDSIWYQMDWRRMGMTRAADLGNARANYSKLLFAPLFLGFNGIGLNAHPDDVRQLNQLFYDQTHHQHGSPIYWAGKIFNMCENGNLRVWSLKRDGLDFIARSTEVASPFSPRIPGGMPGGMMALSANGTKDGVLWAVIPDGDANNGDSNRKEFAFMRATTGRVFAFDAQTWGAKMPDGDTQIQRLWMSDIPVAGHHVFAKFNVPVINDGRVWVPTGDGTILVFGVK